MNRVAFAETLQDGGDHPLGLVAILEDYDAFPKLGVIRGNDRDDEWDLINETSSECSSVAVLDQLDWQYVDRKPTFAQIAERAGTNHVVSLPSSTTMFPWRPQQSSCYPRPAKTREKQQNQWNGDDDDFYDEQPVARLKYSTRATKKGVAKRKDAIVDILLRQSIRLITKGQEAHLQRYSALKIRYETLQKQYAIDKTAFFYHWGIWGIYNPVAYDWKGSISESACINEIYDRITRRHPDAITYCQYKSKEAATRKYVQSFVDAFNAGIRRKEKLRMPVCSSDRFPLENLGRLFTPHRYLLRILHSRDLDASKKQLEQFASAMSKVKDDELYQVLESLPRQHFPSGKRAARIALVREIATRFNEEIMSQYGQTPDLPAPQMRFKYGL